MHHSTISPARSSRSSVILMRIAGKLFLSGLLSLYLQSSYAQPVAGFTASKTSGCSPLLVSFTNTTAGNATSYTWNFGNGNTSSIINPAASFINPGKYTVSLTATGPEGKNTVTREIIVYANPVADFDAARRGGCVNDSICFTDRSKAGDVPISRWSWDFGDGNSSVAQQPPCNRYTFADMFKVTLVVTDSNGCQSTLTRDKYISISDHTVRFTQNRSVSCNPPMNITFKDSTTPANTAYTYLWTLGNGATSANKTVSTTYPVAGQFQVSLKVTAPNGCSKILVRNNAVTIHSPKALLAASVTSGCAPLTVGFTSLSSATDTTVLSYQWKTSAGHIASGKNPALVFTEPGTHAIMLRVTVPGTCADSISMPGMITVHGKTPVSFVVSQPTFCTVPAVATLAAAPAGLNAYTWKWNDGSVNTGQQISRTFNSFGSYDVTLIGKNGMGCADTVSIKNAVRIRKSGFSTALTPRSGCRPLLVSMTASDTGMVPLTRWEWTVSGRPVAISSKASYTFNDTGVFVVKCTGTNESGCSFSLYDTIKVGMETRPAFTPDKPWACYPDASFRFTNLTNVTLPRADAFTWKIGPAVYATENAAHRFTDTGTFPVSLTAVHKGCSTEVISTGPQVKGPKAGFNQPVVNCSNDSIVFTNTSKGGNIWQWDMGDGNTGVERSLKYRYGSTGTYKVLLTVRDTISGCIDTLSRTVMIPRAPVVAFGQSDSVGCSGMQISFTNRCVYDPGTLKGWVWSLSDGQSANIASPSFTIRSQGYFSVSLTFVDQRNCAFTYKKDSAIHIYKGAAAFDMPVGTGCMPLGITVTDRSVTENAVASRKWLWGTGDSSVVSATAAAYAYNRLPADQNEGFPVTLTVTDVKGCRFVAAQQVRPSRPMPEFNHKIIKGCGYDSVMFSSRNAASAGIGPFKLKWDLGDGIISDSSNPVRRYTTGKRAYAIKMIMTDVNGCTDSVVKTVNVNSTTPVAAFITTPEGILDCPGPPIYFIDSSSAGASPVRSWVWDFGDSTRSVLRNPAKTYLVPGMYSLRLTITDSLGCIRTTEKRGAIRISGPVATYKVTPKAGCMPLSVSFKAVSSNTRKFEWDLGDGVVDTNAVHSHTYDRAGMYIPNLTITDSSGCKRALPYADTIRVHALPRPRFASDKLKICKGSSITFNNASSHDKEIITYAWRFGKDVEMRKDRLPVTHTFQQTGTFDVSLKATDVLGCSDTIIQRGLVVVTDDTIPPQVPLLYRATVTGNDRVQMEFSKNTDPDFSEYKIYYNYDAAGVPGKVVSMQLADTVFSQGDINTLENVYSFAVSAKDVCRNESAISPVHSTVQLEATPAVNAIDLSWTAYKGWGQVAAYELYRLDETAGDYRLLHTLPGTAAYYRDTTVLCFHTVYYKIKAKQAGSFRESWSDTSGAQPVFRNTLPATQNIRATVTKDKKVLVQWQKRHHREQFRPVIYRSVDDAPAAFFKEVAPEDTVLTDTDVDVSAHTYSYITYLRDNCGGISAPSNVAKTILLQIELKENGSAQYNPELSWNQYAAWNSGIEKYDIEFKYDSLGAFSNIGSTSPDKLRYFDQYMNSTQAQYCYKVTAYQKNNPKVFSESNTACVSAEPKIYAPTAFTVNGDNLNETFKLGGIFLEDFRISIVNRYGEVVFRSTDINESWDGTVNGNPAPADVYMFLAEGRGRNGKLVTIKGTVTLIR
jgi:gliding motility-associated-like protein